MELKKIGYVMNKDSVMYVDIENGQKSQSSHIPAIGEKNTHYFIHRSIKATKHETTVFEHSHTIVEDFNRDGLFNPEQWTLALECLMCYGSIPTEGNVDSMKFTQVFQTVHADENKLVIKTLSANETRAPAPTFPSLTYMSDKHVICETVDLYRTFARIVSRGRYLTETPHVLKKWLLSKRGNRKIPFLPYFVSVLFELGLPEADDVSIVDEQTIVLTIKGLEWVNERAHNAFDSTVPCSGTNAAILRLGRWTVIPAVIITDEERQQKRLSFDAPTNFVHDFIWKAVCGGEWVKTEDTRTMAMQKHIKAVDFYSRLFRCMWVNKRFIFNDSEVDSSTGQIIDPRPRYLKLYDYVVKDTGCIALPETDQAMGCVRYVDVPWATCCVYNPTRHAVEDAALYQLTEFLKNSDKRNN